MTCFICKRNEGIVSNRKGLYNCECDVYVHDDCFTFYREISDRCPICSESIQISIPLLNEQESRESVPYLSLFFSVSLLVDLCIFLMYFVGITSNEDVENDLKIVIPTLFLMCIDMFILFENVAVTVSSNRFNFKKSLIVSSLVYFLSLVIPILIFTQESFYSVFNIQATYALIIYQCFFAPRVFLYVHYSN